jgi:hypothetical protein
VHTISNDMTHQTSSSFGVYPRSVVSHTLQQIMACAVLNLGGRSDEGPELLAERVDSPAGLRALQRISRIVLEQTSGRGLRGIVPTVAITCLCALF